MVQRFKVCDTNLQLSSQRTPPAPSWSACPQHLRPQHLHHLCLAQSESELLAVFEAAKILTQIMMNNPKIATFDEADQDSDKDSDDEHKGN